MAALQVILFGGSGALARRMTSLMHTQNWNVISVTRDQGQEQSILKLGEQQPGKIRVVISDVERWKGSDDAAAILQLAPIDTVIFAAGSLSNPSAVDRDAMKYVVKASISNPSIAKFLHISFPAARRARAPWWTDKDYRDHKSEVASYPAIQQAKLAADEYLLAMASARNNRPGTSLQAISLRPTWLSNSKGTGRVQLGRAGAVGTVTRDDVAKTAISLLARDDTRGWYDLFQGNVPIDEAVDLVVKKGVSSFEGEDMARISELADY